MIWIEANKKSIDKFTLFVVGRRSEIKAKKSKCFDFAIDLGIRKMHKIKQNDMKLEVQFEADESREGERKRDVSSRCAILYPFCP